MIIEYVVLIVFGYSGFSLVDIFVYVKSVIMEKGKIFVFRLCVVDC